MVDYTCRTISDQSAKIRTIDTGNKPATTGNLLMSKKKKKRQNLLQCF